MPSVDADEQGAYTKTANPNRRRTFSRRRWVKISCLATTLILFAFYFCYYAYYYRSPRVTLNKLITTVATSKAPRKTSERDHLFPPDFDHDQHIPLDTWPSSPGSPRGALYMIVRNENLPEARATMRVIQDRFNDQTKYPWILLNNQHFNADFKKHASAVVTRSNTSIFFGKIDAEAWAYPSWIDVPRAENLLWDLVGVKRGESLSHHQLLRYQAGLFYHHPLFTNVEYTWRIEPGAMYTCALKMDIFRFMKKENKKLGFVMTTKKEPKADPSLWPTTRSFMEQNPHWIKPRNQTILPSLIDNNGDYNHCHMSSNFEVLDLSFVRSEEYQAFFRHLDLASGFFYEKWGDPVRTLAAALFLDKRQVHFFDQVGYVNDDISHCPFNSHSSQQCTCNAEQSHEIHETSCTFDLLRHIDPPSLDSFIHYAQSKIPSHIKIDLNNTDILKQVIKEKDQLVSFLEQHGDLSFNS